jgi:endoglucanase
MDIGWNLGNTFDAWNNEKSGETVWGNPRTTKALIDAVKEAGFTSVRIPVTWMGQFGKGPEYKIKQSWLDRIAEVVGWVRDAGMTCIINIHHDGSDSKHWLDINKAAASAEGKKEVEEIYIALWLQIATYFKDYGDFLMFEPFNELHDGSWGNGRPALYAIVNDLNQIFVDTVRATGGNNTKRYLLAIGYVTRPSLTMQYLKLPKDQTPGRTIVSVHCYDPYNFAIQDQIHVWGTQAEADYFTRLVAELKSTYIDKGIPVFVDEYGAVKRKDPANEKYRINYMKFVTKIFRDAGIVPYYWDNGSTSSANEPFAIFDRRRAALSANGKLVVDAMMGR